LPFINTQTHGAVYATTQHSEDPLPNRIGSSTLRLCWRGQREDFSAAQARTHDLVVCGNRNALGLESEALELELEGSSRLRSVHIQAAGRSLTTHNCP
jgi:hypothetical protein